MARHYKEVLARTVPRARDGDGSPRGEGQVSNTFVLLTNSAV